MPDQLDALPLPDVLLLLDEDDVARPALVRARRGPRGLVYVTRPAWRATSTSTGSA